MSQPLLKVIKSGTMSTIQDGGRHGYRGYGLPTSGFMDMVSAYQANEIVGNQRNGSLIEMIQVGATLKFLQDCAIAITGANMSAMLNGQIVQRYQQISVKSGDQLSFGLAKSNMIGYLAIGGQWHIDAIFGSTATYARAALGGIKGRPLKVGDEISITPSKNKHHHFPEHKIWSYEPGRVLRLIKGPECTQEMTKWLERSTFKVSNQWDRMGVRLKTETPLLKETFLLSCPLAVGTIQLPPDGQPIAVMADGQTTGGYPRLGTIIKADIAYLAQQKPGTTLRFAFVEASYAINIAKWVF